MRVLHVIPSVATRYGGPSRVVVSLCEALAEQGVAVEIAATDADGEERFNRAEWASNVPFHLFEANPRSRVRSSPKLKAWLSANIRNYDLVQTHSVWNDPVHAACSIARKHRVPVVYRPCGMLSDYSWSRGRLMKTAYWWLRERANVRSAAAIHCTSEDERQEAIRCGARPERTVVIPNAVDDDGFSLPVGGAKLREQWKQRIGRRAVVLFLSRLHPKKGLTDFLLPAVAELKDRVHLVIVGGDDDHAVGYRAELVQMIRTLGLQENCELIGAISPGGRWAYFDAADLFVLPSHSENFGIVVAEAMARSCPVLITDGVQMHPHVTRAGAGLVAKPSVDAVRHGLEKMLGDRKFRVLCGQHGHAYALEQFSWKKTASEVKDLYTKILNGSGR